VLLCDHANLRTRVAYMMALMQATICLFESHKVACMHCREEFLFNERAEDKGPCRAVP
jgi:hypothetical protein